MPAFTISAPAPRRGHTLKTEYAYQGSRWAAVLPIRVLRKGELLMTTYEEFQIILTIALLIVAILNMKNK